MGQQMLIDSDNHSITNIIEPSILLRYFFPAFLAIVKETDKTQHILANEAISAIGMIASKLSWRNYSRTLQVKKKRKEKKERKKEEEKFSIIYFITHFFFFFFFFQFYFLIEIDQVAPK